MINFLISSSIILGVVLAILLSVRGIGFIHHLITGDAFNVVVGIAGFLLLCIIGVCVFSLLLLFEVID